MTIETAPRAAWTRCNACQQKVENDRHEINVHKLICPHRLQLQIQKLTERVKTLEGELESLDEQLATDPDVDPSAVAPWPDDDETEAPTGDHPADDDEDEPEDPEDDAEDDDLPVRPTSLYSPSSGPYTP